MKQKLSLFLDVIHKKVDNYILYEITIKSPFLNQQKKGLCNIDVFNNFLNNPTDKTLSLLKLPFSKNGNEEIFLIKKEKIISLQNGFCSLDKIRHDKTSIKLEEMILKDISIDKYSVVKINTTSKLVFSLNNDCIYFMNRYFLPSQEYERIENKKYSLQELYNIMDKIGFNGQYDCSVRLSSNHITYPFKEEDYIESWKEVNSHNIKDLNIGNIYLVLDATILLMKKNDFDNILGFNTGHFRENSNIKNSDYEKYLTKLFLKTSLQNKLTINGKKENKIKI